MEEQIRYLIHFFHQFILQSFSFLQYHINAIINSIQFHLFIYLFFIFSFLSHYFPVLLLRRLIPWTKTAIILIIKVANWRIFVGHGRKCGTVLPHWGASRKEHFCSDPHLCGSRNSAVPHKIEKRKFAEIAEVKPNMLKSINIASSIFILIFRQQK